MACTESYTCTISSADRRRGSIDRAFALLSGGCGFNPWPSNTEDLKKKKKTILAAISPGAQHLENKAKNQN